MALLIDKKNRKDRRIFIHVIQVIYYALFFLSYSETTHMLLGVRVFRVTLLNKQAKGTGFPSIAY
jgi:uncharacterized membrane protein YobD (UPF0266 family)